MLQQLVIVSTIALFLVSGLLFVCGHRARVGHWLVSLGLTAGIGAGAWALAVRFTESAPSFTVTILIAVLAGAGCAALFEDWTSIAHATLAATLVASAAFLSYAAYVLMAAGLGGWSLAFGGLLFLLQLGAHVLVLTHTFEILDVVCRRRWRRRADTCHIATYAPKVSLHVPTHNEPPELVIQTLDALARLEYPDFEVLVVDNNTADDEVWRPVQEHCERLGSRFRFFHLMPWPGFKSGALNFALARTAANAEIVGVIDADYVVAPTFLRDLVGHFADPRIGFVQTPQDYRDVDVRGREGHALYLAYRVFFDISMPSRNERNAIIYAGTMGLLRRSALDEVGGWDEWCITEDAEVSLRLLDSGYESRFVARSYGHGLMPLDFAGLKRQRFRWAFGGMQILRMHAARLFNPWSRGHLTWGQRAAYVIGGLQWLNDPLTFAFTVLLLLGTTALVLGGGLLLQPLAGAVVFVPVLLVLISILRFVWGFRSLTRSSYREAFDVLTILLGLTWVVTLACIRGLCSRRGVFLRTPKAAPQPRLRDVAWLTISETTLAATCLTAAVALLLAAPLEPFSARAVVLMLVLWQAFIYASALRSSVWSYLESRETSAARRADLEAGGDRIGPALPEWRTAAWVGAAGALVGWFFYIAISSAPGIERVMRTDPLGEFLVTRSLFARSPESEAGAILVREADAIRRGDVDAAMRLWHEDGEIHDMNFTPDQGADDTIWSGSVQVRLRYEGELAVRRYRRLQHRNIRVQLSGESAVIENDLEAIIEWAHGVYQIRLPQTDRWTLCKRGDRWGIVRLELNRASDGPIGRSAHMVRR